MKDVILYTDGACSYNPGPGGWAYILMCEEKQVKASGLCENTTNNRMEILAVIEGLKRIKYKCNVTVYTDSAYVYNAFTLGWLNTWQQNNWKNASKKPVLNKELWEELFYLTQQHNVTWQKVKGHADNKYNNECDKMATNEVKEYLKNNPITNTTK